MPMPIAMSCHCHHRLASRHCILSRFVVVVPLSADCFPKQTYSSRFKVRRALLVLLPPSTCSRQAMQTVPFLVKNVTSGGREATAIPFSPALPECVPFLSRPGATSFPDTHDLQPASSSYAHPTRSPSVRQASLIPFPARANATTTHAMRFYRSDVLDDALEDELDM